MNILAIVQDAATELGLPAPATLAGGIDLQINQLLALANRNCTQLARDYNWTDLQNQFVISPAPPVTQTGNVIAGSDILANIPSTAGLDDSYAVSGEGMPQSQRIASVIDASSVRLAMPATAAAVGATFTFAKDTYALPPDFDRYIGNTWWDRTNHWRLIGPDSPQQDQYVRSGIFATGPRRRWRQLGAGVSKWRVWPPPFGTDLGTLVFEYISRSWCQKQDGSFSDRMTDDTDVPLFDPALVTLGVKWRFWQIKGFEYAALQQEYLDAVSASVASDGGIPDLYINRRGSLDPLITTANVQDGNWPGPT